jgi:hypothetical protein
METFKDILCNKPLEWKYWQLALTGFGGIIATSLSTSLYTLIPAHNVIKNPQYWYEAPLKWVLTFHPIQELKWMYLCSFYTNTRFIKTYRHFWVLYFFVALTGIIGFTMAYTIWVYVCKFRYPVPFIGLLVFANINITTAVAMWYRFPREWRHNQWARKRLKFAFLALFYGSSIAFQYGLVTKILITFSEDHQWAVAIFLPFLREINERVLITIASKAANGDKRCINIVCHQFMGLGHAAFLAYTVGSIATLSTSIVIIGTDFLINIFICLKIVYLYYKDENETSKTTQIEMIQDLVISETAEVIVPVCYLICFTMAYYGPNGELIGNILNSYWQFIAIEDVDHTIKYLCIFFFADSLSLVICAIVLWSFCRISLFKAYVVISKEFRWAFNLALVSYLIGYFCLNMIGSALDLTMQFNWIHLDYNYTEPISTSINNN